MTRQVPVPPSNPDAGPSHLPAGDLGLLLTGSGDLGSRVRIRVAALLVGYNRNRVLKSRWTFLIKVRITILTTSPERFKKRLRPRPSDQQPGAIPSMNEGVP